MKKLIMGMLAIATFVFAASAQENRKMKPQKHGHEKGMMRKGLNLTEAQKAQMKTNRENTKMQLADLKKDDKITLKDYTAKKEALLKTQHEQMESVLTPEQKAQWAKNKSERKTQHKINGSKKLDKMKASLNLSDEQVAKLKANHEAGHAKMNAIKDNAALSKVEKKTQLMAIRQEQKESLKQILTPEQFNKMEEKKKAHMEKSGKK